MQALKEALRITTEKGTGWQQKAKDTLYNAGLGGPHLVRLLLTAQACFDHCSLSAIATTPMLQPCDEGGHTLHLHRGLPLSLCVLSESVSSLAGPFALGPCKPKDIVQTAQYLSGAQGFPIRAKTTLGRVYGSAYTGISRSRACMRTSALE